jgi:hypothetical protein
LLIAAFVGPALLAGLLLYGERTWNNVRRWWIRQQPPSAPKISTSFRRLLQRHLRMAPVARNAASMFRFTIRDILMLTALVAICITWLMDRNRIRQDRAQFVKREAELTSQRNIAVAEAERASLREQVATEYQQKIVMALQMRGMDPKDVIDFRKISKELVEREKQRRSNQPNTAPKASSHED